MQAAPGFVRGLALVAFALGALGWAIGNDRFGRRAIAFAIVLVAVDPLLRSGLQQLRGLNLPCGDSFDELLLAIFLVAVLVAGLVALRRTRGGTKTAEGTSQKKRVERA